MKDRRKRGWRSIAGLTTPTKPPCVDYTRPDNHPRRHQRRSAARRRAFSVIDTVLVFNLRVGNVSAFLNRIALMVKALLESCSSLSEVPHELRDFSAATKDQ